MKTKPIVAGFFVFVGLLAANADADEWPRWRGPNGDGTWEHATIPKSFPKSGLEIAWRVPIGPGFAGVVVASGKVYTMDRPGGTETERVVCVSADDGRALWEYRYPAKYGDLDYGNGPRAAPTVFDGRVYTLGAVGHLLCLNADTGKIIWQKDLEKDDSAKRPTWGFAASPVIFQDQVIVHAGLKPGGCYASFDRRTGKEIWRSGKDEVGYGTPVLFRYRNRHGLLGWTPSHVVCMDPLGGSVLWQVPYKVTYGVSIATPLVVDDIVLVCGYWEGSKAIRLGSSIQQAELLWEENKFLRGLMSQPLYKKGHVYLLEKHHGLICFELKTGKKIWTDENRLTPRARNPQATLVWIGDSDHVLSLNAEGELVHASLSPKGYHEIDRTKLVDKTWAHPAYCDRAVFARDEGQLLKAKLP